MSWDLICTVLALWYSILRFDIDFNQHYIWAACSAMKWKLACELILYPVTFIDMSRLINMFDGEWSVWAASLTDEWQQWWMPGGWLDATFRRCIKVREMEMLLITMMPNPTGDTVGDLALTKPINHPLYTHHLHTLKAPTHQHTPVSLSVMFFSSFKENLC